MDFKRKINDLKHFQNRDIMALVTGASSGMGVLYAERLAEAGCNLLIVSNQENELNEVATKISGKFGVNVTVRFQDLADENAAQRLYDFCENEGLIIDILINNAGMFYFEEMTSENDRKTETMLGLHVFTMTKMCRLFGDAMKERRFGYILNVSSLAAVTPFPGIAMYSATKSYIRTFTKALHFEMKYYGVGATVVCPAAIATPLYNLSDNLMKVGLAIGVVRSPEWLVRRALRGMFNRRCIMRPAFQNIYGPVGMFLLPNFLKSFIWRKIKTKQ
ncbi:MAG: SDR family NAD(P)-dependent oxidoreductase [Bacteroidia bacterium]|nr:SDR family NAD(P)-dependent oxidoreductase [Bacteroidia bacterium]